MLAQLSTQSLLSACLRREVIKRPGVSRRWVSMCPSWVTIDLNQIVENYVCLTKTSGVQTLPTLKSNAYGHGFKEVAHACRDAGAKFFAVASIMEAVQLREAGITDDILVMSYVPTRFIHIAAEESISVTVYDAGLVQAYRERLSGTGHRLRCHIKVDSGMGRLGVLPDDAWTLGQALARHPTTFKVEGCLTHFSSADDDLEYTRSQVDRHKATVAVLEDSGLEFKYIHQANSAATLLGQPFIGNLARTGLALYGCQPSSLRSLPAPMAPAVTWTTEVAQVKTLPPHSPVGYNKTYYTSSTETLAMVPVGYGDGFRRGPQHQGYVLIGGVRCPIRGRVSMEKTMVGVDGVPGGVKVGDEVVLIGKQGDEDITPDHVASVIGTNAYEVLCAMLPRESRHYV